MTTLGMPTRPRADHAAIKPKPHFVMRHSEPNAGFLEGELLDLYVAILIVVPLALFLKSLLF